MKNINLNTSDDLLKFKDNINTVLESRIKEAKLNESIDNFKSLTIGDLNSIFESVSDKLFDSEKGKKIIGKYVKALKENKELGKAFAIYHMVKSPEHIADVNLFLSETFSLAGNLDKKQLAEGKKALVKIVSEAVRECGETAENINTVLCESNRVNSAIDYLISNKKTANNIYEHIKNLSVLKEHVSGIIPESVCVNDTTNVKGLSDDLLSTLNEGSLEKWEQNAIWDMISTNLSKGSTESLFGLYKENCINKIDEILEEQENVEEKARLSTMRQQLENKKYSADTLTEDILNLSKLLHTLSE